MVATLKARIATLEAELVAEQQRSAGHRADFERERERADQLVTTQDRMVAELEALRSLLEAAQPRIWREMTCRERIRWLNRCALFWKPRSRLLGQSPPGHGAR